MARVPKLNCQPLNDIYLRVELIYWTRKPLNAAKLLFSDFKKITNYFGVVGEHKGICLNYRKALLMLRLQQN